MFPMPKLQVLFEIETDASGYVIGVVIKKEGRPVW